MTHKLKEVIEAEAEKITVDDSPVELSLEEAYAWKSGNIAGFVRGCNFMVGHLEGLLEFTRAMSWIRTDTGDTLYDLEDGKGYVLSPSQLIDKYFNELNSKG